MESMDSKFRLEEVLTSYYRIQKVDKVNYVQFVPNKPDAQWSIQAELILRKQNPQVLVALFSRELWCFSLNDDDLPSPKLENPTDTPQPDKQGHFTPDISKPNLPTPYAIFLKALRRTIHVNLCLESQSKLIPFGNSCLFRQYNNSNKIVHFEPHLFENGDLCLSVCTKDMDITNLEMSKVKGMFSKENALYLAPSGIRGYLFSTDQSKCFSPPPKNANVLLLTLLVSHGIDLTHKEDLRWVKVIPSLDHLNGYTPSIAGYLDPPKATKTVIWPYDLCYVQSSLEANKNIFRSPQLEANLQETFDIIDDFIQLKLTSAFRTSGSIGVGSGTGTATGNNPTGTGGIYTDQFQQFHKHSASSGQNVLVPPMSQGQTKGSPGGALNLTPGGTSRSVPSSADNFNNGFLTTPNINENVESTIDDLMLNTPSVKVQNDLWNERKEETNNREVDEVKQSMNSDVPTINDEEIDNETDLFGDDEDLFGQQSESNSPEQHEIKEITDEMFDLANESDSSNSKLSPEKQPSAPSSTQTPSKRKYLDIPLEEITLPSTPLYTDPGAPLPVETPKDRKKSVFAPLNFNPIIESNVDNKYKNGGKFSIDNERNEEPLKFDVSTANISSSEDDESASSGEDFDDIGVDHRQDARSIDMNIPMSNFTVDGQPRSITEMIQTDVPKEDSLLPMYENDLHSEKLMRENQLEIWRSPNEGSQEYSPSRLSSQLQPSRQADSGGGATETGDLLKYGHLTPLFEQPSKFTAVGKPTNVDRAPEVSSETVKNGGSSNSSDNLIPPESSNSLPFLLRHMPLFSIPEAFMSHNPSLPRENLQALLDILVEQIVFDDGILGDLGIKEAPFNGFKGCKDGLVKDTIQKIFPLFERLHGNEIIEEMYFLKQPPVYVKKNHDIIKINSDAESFSQYLHLKPFKGIKNFKVLFLTTSLKEDCIDFLSLISQTYSSQDLGFCELIKLTSEDTQGLIYLINFEKDILSLLSAQIVSYCSTNTRNMTSVPLVILLPINTPEVSEIISMVLKFQFIKNEVLSKLPKAQLILKLISMDFIKNPLTSVESYNNLCVGIYNMLPPKQIKFTAIADELPEKVEFRTLQQSNGQAVHFDGYIHLAYARSIDRNWLCASWSNSTGSENAIRAWFIGNSKTAFEEVCNQMWRITLNFAATKYGRICLVLTRLDSVLPDDELMHWRRLSASARNLHLAVVCVGENTKLSLYDEDKLYPSFKPIIRDEKFSRNIDSNNLDDYEIVNIDDAVHGVLFEHPLQLANSQHRCAIKTGALIKFKISEGNEILDKLDVNLLNCPHSDCARLLKIILQEFRNLAALSSWFGITKSENGHIPWHILAVKKMITFIVHARVDAETV